MPAQFTLSSDALPATSRLRAVRGTERLSQPYAFDLVVELEPQALQDLDAPVGKPATIVFHDDAGMPQDAIHGILSTLELVDAQTDRELYLARLVPRLWWLGQNRHSRVFVDEKLPTIVDRVLRSAGWGDDDFRVAAKGGPGVGFPVLEHVCQYRESDLDFLSRWMEREGIYYYFEEGKNGEKLVVTDDAETHRSRVAGAQAWVPRTGGGGSRAGGFRTFRRTSHAQPAGVRLADYNYMHPDLPVQHEEKKGAGELVSLFGENMTTPEQAKWLTQVRTQELRAQQVVYRGVGRVHGIHPAVRFSLDEHPRLTEQLMAVEVVHRGLDLEGRPGLREPIEEALGEELDDEYVVEVVAIPAAVQFRPPRVTPTPRITGMESAVVDAAVNDRYAHLDDHGRYNVRFKFDESDLEDGRASTRMRMVQPHGGAEEGFHFPLRKGTEVMVAFVGGDPDRPIIAGVSPNVHTPSPVTKANATQNVIATGGGNKLVMEDTANQQWIDAKTPNNDSRLHLGAGENNLELSTDGVGRIHTGQKLTLDVGGEQLHHVSKKLTENYDDLQETTVKQRKETVNGTVTETYNGHYEQKVTKGGLLREVTGDSTETFKGKLQHTVEKNLNQTVKGELHQLINEGKVKIDAVGGDLVIDAEVGILLKSKGPIKQKGETVLWNDVPAKIEHTPFKGTLANISTVTATPHAANFVGMATNVFATKIEGHGVKIDGTVVKVDRTKAASVSKNVLTIEQAKMAIKKEAALKIATGALLLQLTKFTILGR